ncbi:MAG: DUF3291 domain-containing protein [Rhodobacteraceae bacterium]|nr:DUF3291 domain-containing protein [Paracoccaceae bacterium]
MVMKLALYTFGQFNQPSDHPDTQGFHDRNDANLAAVDLAFGLIGRSGYDGDPGPECWGVQVYPRFWTDTQGDGWAPSTLSLWQDMESIWAFTYSGIHAEAVAKGRNWFRKGDWPPLAMWWTADRPDWTEAVARYEYLHDHGSSAFAFGFRQAYTAQGAPLAVNRVRVREISARNAAQ